MPLFFWIVIGAAGVILAALVVILLAELGSQRRKKHPGRGSAPAAEAREKAPPETPVKPAEEAVAEEAAAPAAKVPEAEEIVEPAETAALSETAEVAETAGVFEVAEPVVEAAPEARTERPAEAAAAPTPYPEFSNARAVEELGLTQEEADLFVGELVTQIEAELPALEAAAAANDAEKLEEISHLLKGSSTSLGTGGVADVLSALNTACKTGGDPRAVQQHIDDLHYYFGELKAQFGG